MTLNSPPLLKAGALVRSWGDLRGKNTDPSPYFEENPVSARLWG
jgi:hypothetical protein